MKILKVSILTLCCLSSNGHGQPSPNAPANPKEITVEAYIDGPSALHLTLNGIYWTNSSNAKPGRHDAHNYPTYIDGKSWKPKWGKDGDDRGNDKSDVYPLKLTSTEYELEVVGISDKKGSSQVDRRTAPAPVRENGEFVVNITDPESGAKWYKLRLRLRR